jgi:predicted RNA-binding Zn ribbon-like protein
MAHRKFLPIEDVQLVGGALCLDFVNTTGRRESGTPRERLVTLHDVLVFCERAGVVDARQVRGLASRLDRTDAPAAMHRVLDVREALYRLLRAVVGRTRPADADVAILQRELEDASRSRRLTWSGGQPRWTWTPGPTGLGDVFGPIVTSAARLLESPDALASLKKCGECDWLFLDTTRNQSRSWCKTTCGDRVKARRYYARHRRAGGR